MNDILSQNVEATPARVWSPLQEAIFAACRGGAEPLLIQAVAGSGKTTTIIESTRWTKGPTLFLAFAKSNAEDIRGKLPAGEAKTLNALGHRLWMVNSPNSRLEARKTERLVEQVMPEAIRRKFGYIVQRIIGSAKGSGLGLESEVSPRDFERLILAGDWDIDDQDILGVSEYAARIFSLSRDDLSTFDFDDQLYGPIYRGWEFPAFGTVLIDEAQDLNRIQHLMLGQLVDRGARLIAVGDRNQAIYGFRGALHDSLDLLKQHFRMRELPLSITYRCPQRVVEEAQRLVPHIEARPGAPTGWVFGSPLDLAAGMSGVEMAGIEEGGDPKLFPEGWLVVCRNNAPLFAQIMQQVRARRPCRVLSNALDGLASFIRKFQTPITLLLKMKVDKWLDKERAAAEAKGMDWKIAALEDKAATVHALCEGFSKTEDVLNLIRQLAEGRSGPLFSTIHKAKGLEAEHVYFLRPDLVPGWWVKDEAALQQEHNLRYVAITRARSSLTYGVKK